MGIELVITEILMDGYFQQKETYCLKCRCFDGTLVAFWGEHGEANRNIVALRHQKLPLHIALTDPGGVFAYRMGKEGIPIIYKDNLQ